MTSQKIPSSSVMIRKFTQKVFNFRGEVEMLNMKMTELMHDWLEVAERYEEETKARHLRHKAKAILNRKKQLSASTDNDIKKARF